jgi:RNA polymerase sigma-70 factor (ECF subfamily)
VNTAASVGLVLGEASVAAAHNELRHGADGETGSLTREQQFVMFFESEFDALARYISRLCGNRGLGEDLAQEALVRTWTTWTHVREPHAYAYLVATNLVRREWKRRGGVMAVADLPEEMAPPPDVRRAAGEAAVDIRDLVDRLPRKLREAVLLHYFADLSVEQVAATTGRPPGSIRRQLHEARAHLRSAWSQS